MLSSHASHERVLSILSQLCAISFMDTPDATSHSTATEFLHVQGEVSF
ncbi:hypothetical protein ANCCAN_30608 [Ancylostoma caninum]|uniref:Uncharacterized protein n=1 Tax=Ancylostoma caninum TaxID=29170 RepID=A0A368EYE8_ANCCA|nr:hypothetical protein ANCCAN_30608 [Ancylostoma caninum]